MALVPSVTLRASHLTITIEVRHLVGPPARVSALNQTRTRVTVPAFGVACRPPVSDGQRGMPSRSVVRLYGA